MNKNTIKVMTYNVDGLPNKLDLNDLPKICKPLVWLYKKIKGTTLIPINDNSNAANNLTEISKYIDKIRPDIFVVQEDFNYHKELTSELYDKYSWGKYAGGFDLDKIFTAVSGFPPRFDTDGLNIFSTINNHLYISGEKIVKWNKSYGYISHANDKLTRKGFRYNTVSLENGAIIDVINVHMDADFYDPVNCPDVTKDIEARKSQFKQLIEFIKNLKSVHPIIVMGDTNSYNKYEWDKENIKYFVNSINNIPGFLIEEAIPKSFKDCDRIFIINRDRSRYKLQIEDCDFDTSINLSDHVPLIAQISVIELSKPTVITCPKCGKETSFYLGDAIDELGEVFKCEHCDWPFRYVKN